MPMPQITTTIAKTVTPIIFNLPTLKRIEQSTGMTLPAIIEKFNDMLPERGPAGADGKRPDPTPEQLREAARKFEIGFCADFLAGAANLPLEQIALEDVTRVFNEITPTFAQAWNQLMGGEADEAPKASAGSPPGPG